MDAGFKPDIALRLFEAAFEQEAMGMALRAIDPLHSRWLLVNNKLCDILGYTREELLQLTSVDISLPEERQLAVAYNERLLQGDLSSYSREKRYVRKDGRVIWANVWLSAVLGPDDKPTQIISVIQDITERKRADALKREAENRFRDVVNSSPAAITLKDRNGRFQIVNRTYGQWMGIEPSELVGKTIRDVFPEDPADEIETLDRKVLDGGEEIVSKGIRPFGDGVVRTVMTHKCPIYSVDGEISAVSTIITDITQSVRADELLRERERRFRDFAESASDWFWETGPDFRFTYLSERFHESTGFHPDSMVWTIRERHLDAGDSGSDSENWESHLADLDAHRPFKNFEHGYIAPDGTTRYARISGTPVFGVHGQFLGYRGTGADITEAVSLSEQLSHQANHDALTGLINRHGFERRLRRMLKAARDGQGEHALCYLDLDQFKVINDTCGHMAGDELLRQLGQLLPEAVRMRDTLARLGGDEFGVLMEHCSTSQARRVANKLHKLVSDFRFAWEDQIFHLGVSIGLVPINEASTSIAEVLKAADSACYAAKDEGRNRVHVYHPDNTELARRHGEMRWVSRLNQALEEDRFQLWSQPIIPVMADAHEGMHFEVLLRMVDESGKVILPGVFLPAAERYGLSTKLDCWVISAVFDWLIRDPSRLQQLHLCAINLSGASLGDESFLKFVRNRFSVTRVPAEKICFEITETAAIAKMTQALKFMKNLRALGCHFSLDDFGSGLSSFAYLKNLPVDYLKIDGVFVKDILDDEVDLALVRSIHDVGRVIGKRTIAEFVESKAILHKLREVGVDYAQGFGVGRPFPLEDIEFENA